MVWNIEVNTSGYKREDKQNVLIHYLNMQDFHSCGSRIQRQTPFYFLFFGFLGLIAAVFRGPLSFLAFLLFSSL